MAREPDEREYDEPFDDDEPQDLGGDAGRLDDEGGDEPQDRLDDQAGQAEEGRRTRTSQRVGRYDEVSRAARDANDRAARLEQELMQLRAQMSQPRQESEVEFEAKLQLMEPQDQSRARYERARAENNRQNEITRMQAADMIDRTQYDTNARHDQRYKRYQSEVEKLRLQELQQGRVHSRENLLTYIIGREALAAKPKIDKARQDAQQRVRSQQARTGSARSDQPRGEWGRRGTGNSLADLEHRLKDVII